jgi:hypothetical protein
MGAKKEKVEFKSFEEFQHRYFPVSKNDQYQKIDNPYEFGKKLAKDFLFDTSHQKSEMIN